jgi:hypothetical protein
MVAADSDDWLLIFETRLAGLRFAPVFWLSSLLFVLGLIGVFWSIPVPEEFFRISPLLNWGSALLMVTAVYYFIISLPLAVGMLPLLLVVSAMEFWFVSTSLPTLLISGLASGVAIIGLCVARRSIPAVLRDLQFAMLAPAYLLSVAYRKFGIPI